jgi:hypothetical protein
MTGALVHKWLLVQGRVAMNEAMEIWSAEARATDAAHFASVAKAVSQIAGQEKHQEAIDLLMLLNRWAQTWISRTLERVHAGGCTHMSNEDAKGLLEMFDLEPTLVKSLAEKSDSSKQVFVAIQSWILVARKSIADHLVIQVKGPNDNLLQVLASSRALIEKGFGEDLRQETIQFLDLEKQFSESVSKVEVATVGDSVLQVLQCISRLCRCSIRLAHLMSTAAFDMKKAPISMALAQSFADLNKELAAMLTWLQGVGSKLEHLGLTLELDAKSLTESLRSKITDVVADVVVTWDLDCKDLAKKIQTLLPAKNLVESPGVLVKAPDRETLNITCKKLHESKLLTQAGEKLCVLKAFEDLCPSLKGRVHYSSLSVARCFGKVAMGVNWAVDEIATFKPNVPADLVERAMKVEAKLKAKGLGGQDCTHHASVAFARATDVSLQHLSHVVLSMFQSIACDLYVSFDGCFCFCRLQFYAGRLAAACVFGQNFGADAAERSRCNAADSGLVACGGSLRLCVQLSVQSRVQLCVAAVP